MWTRTWFSEPTFKLPKYDKDWKEPCRRCRYVRTATTGQGDSSSITVLRCSLVRASKDRDGSCIGARTEGGICGPRANLWAPERRVREVEVETERRGGGMPHNGEGDF